MPTERTVLVRLKADASPFVRGMATAKAAVADLTSEIDTSNNRTAYLAQGFLALGPTLAPLGAAAVPVLSGLSTQLTVAAIGAGTAALAFNGVGDALKALNDYQLEPTDAHLVKLNQTLKKIGPDGAQFVQFLDSIGPKLSKLADEARSGLFPGVTAGIENLLTLLPQVQRIVAETSRTLGDLAEQGGAGLAGPRFTEFFNYLENDAQPILRQMAATAGNLADGFAAMLVAFAPLSADFSSGFEHMSKSFADWAHQLETSQSFADFVRYIRESGPKVADLLGAIADAVVQIIEAAAPVGNVMLPVFTELFKIIAAIADSPLGPVFIGSAAAIGLYGRAVAIASVTTAGLTGKLLGQKRGIAAQTASMAASIPTLRQFGNSLLYVAHSEDVLARSASGTSKVGAVAATRAIQSRKQVQAFGKSIIPTVAQVGLLVASTTGLDEKLGLTNTTSLALAGSLAGPLGTAVGAAAGGFLDLKAAIAETGDVIDRAKLALQSGTVVQQEAARAALQTRAAYLANGNGFKVNFDRVVAFATGMGDQLLTTSNQIDQAISDSTANVGGVSDLLTQTFAPAIQQTGRAFEITTQDAQAFSDTLAGIDTQLKATDALLAYRQGIIDVKKALKENGPTVANNTKGLANLRELQAFAHDIVNALNTMPEGPERDAFFKAATDKLVNLANLFDSTGRTAKEFKREFGLLDNATAKPTFDANDKPLNDAVARANRIIDQLSGRTVTIPVTLQLIDDVTKNTDKKRHKHQTGGLSDLLNPDGFADGGFTGPGAKYQPAGTVHAGEFVFSSEATRGNVRFLEGLHAEMRGYSGGGHVTAAPQIDYDRLGAVIAAHQGRQLYGDVHITGDPTTWKRQMEQDYRMASLGGARP